MDQQQLQPIKEINELTFYKHPYLPILIATKPATAINDLSKLWTIFIKDQVTAGLFLETLIGQGRKTGLQFFLEIVSPSVSLPVIHRLTPAVLTLDKTDEIYITPKSSVDYSLQRLQQLFQI